MNIKLPEQIRKYKLIIVENDEDEQYFMREGFEQSGLFDILALLRNGDLLLEWIHSKGTEKPELILSDLNMPGKNGYEILSFLKEMDGYKNIPVIITSTSSTNSIMQKCLDAGAADYVIKPDIFIDYLSYAKALHKRIQEKKLV